MDDSPTVALVTGASRGIGRAISIELGKMGHVVVGTATTQQGADNISAYMAEQGIKGKGFAADVSNDDSVSALMAAITKEFSAPLIVVNNAGITRDNLLMRMKTGEWEDVINTNLGSMYRICKATVKGMTKARFGRIVNISSVVGSSGNGGQTNYSASKAGRLYSVISERNRIQRHYCKCSGSWFYCYGYDKRFTRSSNFCSPVTDSAGTSGPTRGNSGGCRISSIG
jgi:NAD(P)-dependent dehydrogenase (short-subunit alcohol dehydrogenase family)